MTSAGDVCAVLVTRGDVDMEPIIDTLPYAEVIVWDNALTATDWGVFGRYMGILSAKAPVIYFQDDDCLVRNHDELLQAYEPGAVVGNFRRDGARERHFKDTTLLGWGSLFDRDLPWRGLAEYADHYPVDRKFLRGLGMEFTWPLLTRRATKVLVDIEPGGKVEWLAEDGQPVFARGNRMSQQPGFYEELDEVLARARMVRDA